MGEIERRVVGVRRDSWGTDRRDVERFVTGWVRGEVPGAVSIRVEDMPERGDEEWFVFQVVAEDA